MTKFQSKSIKLTLVFLLISIFCTAPVFSDHYTDHTEELEDLANYDSVTYDITVIGNFELIEQSSSASLREAIAELLLKVQEENSYTTLNSESVSSEGKISDTSTTFTFTNKEPLEKTFSYSANVKIDSTKHLIQNSAPFPIELTNSEIEEYQLQEYLAVTDTIDWENDEIKRRASSLAQGQTDLFETLVDLASWVERNIEYNLSTLNVEASHPASSVLESREGVCDEMTSLFISFSRSLGIPARFVSGLTYTRSDLFDEPWQAHGWAEVYIPHSGWISFDPTFGQYGFVDSTHIPLKYSVDPTEPSVLYEWTANKISLESKEMDFTIDNNKFGYKSSPNLEVEADQHASIVDFGSHNLISATVKNKKNSRQAVELKLITPEEVSSVTDEVKVIVIDALGESTVQWIVQVEDALKSEYIYSFPYIVLANSQINGTNTFSAGKNKPSFEKEEMESLYQEETITMSKSVEMDCEYPESIYLEESALISCEVKNKGNQVIEEAKVCITEVCEYFELLLSEKKTIKESISFTEPGYQNIETTIKYNGDTETQLLNILVLDQAQIKLESKIQNQIKFGEITPISFTIDKSSVSTPKNVSIEINTGREKFSFEIPQIETDEEFSIDLDTTTLSKNNQIKIKITWFDDLQENYYHSETINLEIEPTNLVDSTKQLINRILIFFTV